MSNISRNYLKIQPGGFSRPPIHLNDKHYYLWDAAIYQERMNPNALLHWRRKAPRASLDICHCCGTPQSEQRPPDKQHPYTCPECGTASS